MTPACRILCTRTPWLMHRNHRSLSLPPRLRPQLSDLGYHFYGYHSSVIWKLHNFAVHLSKYKSTTTMCFRFTCCEWDALDLDKVFRVSYKQQPLWRSRSIVLHGHSTLNTDKYLWQLNWIFRIELVSEPAPVPSEPWESVCGLIGRLDCWSHLQEFLRSLNTQTTLKVFSRTWHAECQF